MFAFSPSAYLRRRSEPREGRMASLHVAQARVAVIIVRMDVKMPNVTFMVFSGERWREIMIEMGVDGFAGSCLVT